jgi:hypothetical protein
VVGAPRPGRGCQSTPPVRYARPVGLYSRDSIANPLSIRIPAAFAFPLPGGSHMLSQSRSESRLEPGLHWGAVPFPGATGRVTPLARGPLMAKPQPPWAPGKGVRVLRVDPETPVVVLFLGPLLGHLEHWVSKATVPCLGLGGNCPNHSRGRLLFYAYAPVLWQDPRTNRPDPWILQATASLEEQLRGIELRGQVWLLTRDPDGGKTAEVVGKFVEKRNADSLPPPHAVVPHLRRMFQVKELNLPVANPNPPKVVPEVADVAPLVLAEVKPYIPMAELSAEERQKAQARLQAARDRINGRR